MMTYRNTTNAFFILLFTLTIARISGFQVHFYYYILLVTAYLTFTILMSFFIGSGFHMKALCSAKTEEKMVSLTFDDGPDPVLTPELMDQLHCLGIPVTFFCIGRKIEENKNLLKRMHAEGHLIGTHSFSHSNWFDFFSSVRMHNELVNSSRLVFEAIGRRPLLFRPPYGVTNPMLKKALKGLGLHVIGFSNRAWDTSRRKEEVIISRIIKNLKSGDIILLHDTVPETINAIWKMVVTVHNAGYQFVPLDKLLNIPAYEA